MQSSWVIQQHWGATAAPDTEGQPCILQRKHQTGGLGFWQQWDIDGLDRAWNVSELHLWSLNHMSTWVAQALGQGSYRRPENTQAH